MRNKKYFKMLFELQMCRRRHKGTKDIKEEKKAPKGDAYKKVSINAWKQKVLYMSSLRTFSCTHHFPIKVSASAVW